MKTIQEKYSDALVKFREDSIELVTKLFREEGNKLSEPIVLALMMKDNRVIMGLLAGLGKLFTSDEGKEAAVEVIKELSKEMKPIAIAFCCEGWASSIPIEEQHKPYPKPSLDPQRKEVLFVTFETHDQESGHYMEIVREKGVVELTTFQNLPWESKKAGRLGGIFSNLLQDNYSEFAKSLQEQLKENLN